MDQPADEVNLLPLKLEVLSNILVRGQSGYLCKQAVQGRRIGVHGYKRLVPGIVPIVGERRPRVMVSIQLAIGARRRPARKHSIRPYQ